MGQRIAILAGGTGGHIFPALAVAEMLRQAGAEVFWVGTRAGMEARLVPEQGLAIEWIGIEGVRGKGAGAWLKAPMRLGRAVGQAHAILRQQQPGAVLGMGGFVSAPGGLAAQLLGIPLLIHEQNSIPGLANRLLAHIADRVFESFPGSFPSRRGAILSGNPVRQAIIELPPPEERMQGRTGPAHLLVLGGSLGAQALNRTLPQALALLDPAKRPLVLHQAGERLLAEAQAAYQAAGLTAEVVPFIRDMAAAYAWADLVVCRAGALTVSELAAAGLGAILVPYPYAVDDHQRANARYLAEAGAARLIIQQELTPEHLAATLRPLLADRAACLSLAQAAHRLARPQAAAEIASACLELAAGRDV
ncbi:undecaprenyldiphospho-muramoylpentapeptide beta-N-acetylglucosaminyltransferase [Caldichromatium japonicum]|uniref:UDP-N-acetylglucosamine--N-acetylmuramyl-(pentapeptide) pyrophosphoryl-undecaprenol N-acetylglucosamine transferase n=1 Tax=Caldichromatium japonicum TaxID=2699430 RepID=A0A6G7VEQ0_9GAMM|nr:undecaprenyldiphospho-muramoylpentapeptide beta-N-acetylglucosaminyltransferase [Caldichromatium japonicum]QIK38380.1 undecaprenyldiphospho-muramoylpentapeptide beta-N-acetylglucosaminyltransferase [Caldichromatium japonicum]